LFMGVTPWTGQLREIEIFSVPTSNQAPTVSVSSPSNNSQFTVGSAISLTTSTGDPDASDSVTQVKFYNGTTLLTTVTQAPFSYSWTNAILGSHTLTAKAFDTHNDSTVSASISIVVHDSSSTGNVWHMNGNSATDTSSFIGTTNGQSLVFKSNNIERLRISDNGFVGIGISASPDTEALLAVDGAIFARKLKVTQATWADYVFAKNYSLPSLQAIEAHIKKYGHLPGVPSEKQVLRDGINVGDNQAVLIQKIEELTLYIIDQNKQLIKLQHQVKQLNSKQKK
jgi:hypothetical protein